MPEPGPRPRSPAPTCPAAAARTSASCGDIAPPRWRPRLPHLLGRRGARLDRPRRPRRRTGRARIHRTARRRSRAGVSVPANPGGLALGAGADASHLYWTNGADASAVRHDRPHRITGSSRKPTRVNQDAASKAHRGSTTRPGSTPTAPCSTGPTRVTTPEKGRRQGARSTAPPSNPTSRKPKVRFPTHRRRLTRRTTCSSSPGRILFRRFKSPAWTKGSQAQAPTKESAAAGDLW